MSVHRDHGENLRKKLKFENTTFETEISQGSCALLLEARNSSVSGTNGTNGTNRYLASECGIGYQPLVPGSLISQCCFFDRTRDTTQWRHENSAQSIIDNLCADTVPSSGEFFSLLTLWDLDCTEDAVDIQTTISIMVR